MIFFNRCRRLFNSQFFIALLFILPLAVCGCGGGAVYPDDTLSAFETASYLPLNSSNTLVYSNGEKVYEAKYMGEVDAAGVRAVKFGCDGFYNLFSEDSDSINLCGTDSFVFDRPLTLFSKKAQLYEQNTSSVTINGQKTLISSYFTGFEEVTTTAGTFSTLRFQITYMKELTGEVDRMQVINLAKNVGIVVDRIITPSIESATTLIAGTTENAIFTKQKKEWAFLIYSCGHNPSNDLSTALYNQLKGFENAGIGRSAYMVAQIAPTNKVLYGLTTRFALENDRLAAVKTITGRSVDTGDTSEIMNFYNWAAAAYPAEHYALFISGHGSGAISILYPDGGLKAPGRVIAYDDTARDSLNLPKLSEVYRSLVSQIGKKIDIIVYDSCVMQMFEVAYQLKDFADYYVASQAALAGEGIDMLEFSKKFNSNADHSALSVSKMLTDAYVDSPGRSNSHLTMSVTKLSMCSQVKTLIDSFADGLEEIRKDSDASAFLQAVYGVQRFGSLDYNDYTGCYADLFDFAQLIDKYIDPGKAKSAATALIQIENEKSFVVYNRNKGDYFKGADGISIFIARRSADWINSNYTRSQYRYFSDFGRDSKWYDFLDGWSALLSADGK